MITPLFLENVVFLLCLLSFCVFSSEQVILPLRQIAAVFFNVHCITLFIVTFGDRFLFALGGTPNASLASLRFVKCLDDGIRG
jgi:hypothetical protein